MSSELSNGATMLETAKAPGWQMPPVSVGQIVYWWMDGTKQNGQAAFTAVVTKVFGRCVNIAVIPDMQKNFKLSDAVRHIDDPDSKIDQVRESGCWEHTPQTEELMALRHELGMAKLHIDALRKRVDRIKAPDNKEPA